MTTKRRPLPLRRRGSTTRAPQRPETPTHFIGSSWGAERTFPRAAMRLPVRRFGEPYRQGGTVPANLGQISMPA